MPEKLVWSLQILLKRWQFPRNNNDRWVVTAGSTNRTCSRSAPPQQRCLAWPGLLAQQEGLGRWQHQAPINSLFGFKSATPTRNTKKMYIYIYVHVSWQTRRIFRPASEAFFRAILSSDLNIINTIGFSAKSLVFFLFFSFISRREVVKTQGNPMVLLVCLVYIYIQI